jgi:hypothetical protein
MGKFLSLADVAFLKNSAGITPDSFPGLTSWWKADSFSEADGTPVCTIANPWVNQALGGNAFTAGTAPKFKTNIVGTKPVVRFDGAALGSPIGFTEETFAGDYTIIVLNSTPTHFQTLFMKGSTSHDLRRCTQANPPSVVGRNISSVYDGGAASPPLEWWGGNVSGGFPATPVDSGGIEWPVISDNFQVNVYRRTGQAIDFRQNKFTRAGSGNSGLRSLKLGLIGDLNGAGGGAGDVDFGEILLYASYLSDSDLDTLYDSYFKPRWTTLP